MRAMSVAEHRHISIEDLATLTHFNNTLIIAYMGGGDFETRNTDQDYWGFRWDYIYLIRARML